MRHRIWLLSLLFSLASCSGPDETTPSVASPTSDDDADGLTLEEETALGTDPANPDSDSDGVGDGDEVTAGTNPLAADSDDDGLSDGREAALGTNPLVADTDEDSLSDGEEVIEIGSNPLAFDTDGDGISDPAERSETLTDPSQVDTDDDGISDYDEVTEFGSDPASADGDGDGLSDSLEAARGTHPSNPDTDGDGLRDGDEILVHATDPLLEDTDADELSDGAELQRGTDALFFDSDFDGLSDGDEQSIGSDPLEPDSDADGVSDGDEVLNGTDPLVDDSDADGSLDGEEAALGSDPLAADTDGDGLSDGEEATAGSSPLAADSDEDGLSDFAEVRIHNTEPDVADTDADGLSDSTEVENSLDPLDPSDAAADGDGDGLSNADELAWGTSLVRPDSDGDRSSDGDEVANETDPLDPDSDDDGVADGVEISVGADPNRSDSDDDGIGDGAEPERLLDRDGDGLAAIVDPDADGDGWADADEIDPLGDVDSDGVPNVADRDADGDGMADGPEIENGLDPHDPADGPLDPDADGLPNVAELARGTDPSDPDTDADGLSDGDEVNNSLDPTDGSDAAQDFDHDTLSNAEEVAAGTDVRSDDTDGDGLVDDLELLFGADPLNPDTDEDGAADGDEPSLRRDIDGDGLIGVLDPDSDDDGISDGDELAAGFDELGDADGDGIDDLEERLAGTDPALRDTDGDGLHDDTEIAGCEVEIGGELRRIPTSPTREDTDGDGIRDGEECALGLHPVDADTDGDGLSDGDEAGLCGAEEPGCTEGDWVLRSDPLNPDTDSDGVPDGFDLDPMERDFDGDGLIDSAELVDGFNARIVEYAPTPGVDFLPDAEVHEIPLVAGEWLVAAALVSRTEVESPGVRIDSDVQVTMTLDGVATAHSLRASGPQMISQAPIAIRTDTAELSFGGDGVQVHRVMLFTVASPDAGVPPVATIPTLADVADSDDDGLSDAEESLAQGLWIEAEHHATAPDHIVASIGASNGRAVQMDTGSSFALGGADWGWEAEQSYAVFARARRTIDLLETTSPSAAFLGGKRECFHEYEDGSDDPIDPTGTCGDALCVYEEYLCFDETCSDGREVFVCEGFAGAETFRPAQVFEWHYAGTYRSSGEGFQLVLTEAADAESRWELDRVLVVPGSFSPSESRFAYDDIAPGLGAEFRVDGLDSASDFVWRQDLPWGFSDPMDADTDGDGVRHRDGVIAGSAGWLTDGVELNQLRTNSFDIDSDLDGWLGEPVGESLIDRFTDLFWDGASLSLLGGPDGEPDYSDASDPSPRPLDFDRDGLLDAIEIRGQLSPLREACAEAAALEDPACEDIELCAACPLEDYDGAEDLDGICSLDLSLGSNTLPLCWYADDDRDDDGLRDGTEDLNRNGIGDPEELDLNSADTDGDCIPDGVELGLVCPEAADTLLPAGSTLDCGAFFDVTSGFSATGVGFVPDADPAERTSPLLTDTDEDGVSDGDGSDEQGAERPDTGFYGEDLNCNGAFAADGIETNPRAADTDGDLLVDGRERSVGADPLVPDTDEDGLIDGTEVLHYGTDPTVVDTDDDGLSDQREVQPNDGDPITDPTNPDTDGDTLSDGDELLGQGALAGCEWAEVCGARGSCESEADCAFPPTDPTRVDTDGDGIDDGDELGGPLGSRTNPASRDTDGDRLSDLDERDGLGLLTPYGPSNPLDADSDGDGFLDAVELASGSDPVSAESFPTDLVVATGGLALAGVEWTPIDGGLQAAGSIALACEGREPTARVDGDLVLTEANGIYEVTGTGSLVMLGAADREEVVYSGALAFSADGDTVSAGEDGVGMTTLSLAGGAYVVDFTPPACDEDTPCARGECTDGVCPGVAGPDYFDVCRGVIEDETAIVTMAGNTSSDPALVVASQRTTVDPRRESVAAQNPTHLGSFSSVEFPWEGRTCFREPVTIHAITEMIGDFEFSPNPDVAVGTPPRPGQPSGRFGGVGSVSYPGVNGPSLMHRLSGVSLDALTGQVSLSTDFDFEALLGEFGDLGAFFESGLLSVGSAGPCMWDFNRGMFSCEMSYTRRKRQCSSSGSGSGSSNCQGGQRRRGPIKYIFDGRIDLHIHGMIPFQTIEAHDFRDLSCGEGVDLCQDGQLGFNGRVRVPIPSTPGLEAIIEGDLVADVTTRDGDDVFVGVFGTFSLGQRVLTEISDAEVFDFPFPLRLELANATTAFVFEDDELEQIVFHSLKGWSMVDQFEIPDLPVGVVEMFDAERGEARGCLDVDTGRVEGIGTIYPRGFRYDLGFTITPPYRDGEPDLSAGSFAATGSMTFDRPFSDTLTATMDGEIGFDGRFRFTGRTDDEFTLPGLPALSIPSAEFTVSNTSARLEGTLPLPGLGGLHAEGEITSRGGFDFGLSGDLSVLGFNFSSVRGRLNSSGGAQISGELALPLGNNGSPVNVSMAGWYRSETDWGLSSISSVSVPFGGPTLQGMRVTAGPSGVALSGRLSVPGLVTLSVAGSVQTNGGFSLSGTFSVGVGALSISGGRLTIARGSGTSLPSISATGRVSISGMNLASADLQIGLDGSLTATGRTNFVSQTFTLTLSRPPGGLANATGSVSVGACISRLCISGTITANIGDSGVGATFRGSGLTLGVRSNGCVHWEIAASCGRFQFFCPGIPVTVCL